jgi:PadR family transcriptional regulator PadR
MDLENAKAQMRKGVLELCILAIATEKEVYPGDIITRLKENDLIVVEGTLYPLLTRLKNDQLLEYTWRESSSGPPRKYFTTTENGRSVLAALRQSWDQLVASVKQTLEETPPAEPPENPTDTSAAAPDAPPSEHTNEPGEVDYFGA